MTLNTKLQTASPENQSDSYRLDDVEKIVRIRGSHSAIMQIYRGAMCNPNSRPVNSQKAIDNYLSHINRHLSSMDDYKLFFAESINEAKKLRRQFLDVMKMQYWHDESITRFSSGSFDLEDLAYTRYVTRQLLWYRHIFREEIINMGRLIVGMKKAIKGTQDIKAKEEK